MRSHLIREREEEAPATSPLHAYQQGLGMGMVSEWRVILVAPLLCRVVHVRP